MRRNYLDNLRWATVLLVLVYHVCYLFNGVGILGNIPGAPNLPAGDWFAAAVYPWFMALLFLAAGMSSRFALENRTAKEFLRERATKLLVPSTLGLFALHWVTGYLNIKMGGGLEYIPGFLVYPISAVSGTGPLWFAQMLFVFSCVLVLLKKADRGDRLWEWGGRLPVWAGAVAALFVLWGGAQVGNLPVLTMYRFGIYLGAFLLGHYVFSHDGVIDALAKGWLWLTALAVLAGGAYLYRYGGGDYTDPACLRSFLTNCYAWLAVLALLGLFRRWFDRTNAFCGYLVRASFGLYVLHYPVFLWTGYLLTAYCALPAAANYLILLVCGTALTFAVYEGLRRVPGLRFLVLGQKGRGTKNFHRGK